MKKIITVLTMSALIAGGVAFAQNADKPREDFKGHHGVPAAMIMQNQNVIIGQVKQVGSESIKIVNTDGKDVDIKIVPFSVIDTFKNDKQTSSLSDVKKGDWVIVSTFKTDSKIPVASFVCVKQTKTSTNSTQLSTGDAK